MRIFVLIFFFFFFSCSLSIPDDCSVKDCPDYLYDEHISAYSTDSSLDEQLEQLRVLTNSEPLIRSGNSYIGFITGTLYFITGNGVINSVTGQFRVIW